MKQKPVEGQGFLADFPTLTTRPPVSDWMPPTGSLPELRGQELGLDTEVRDGGLEAERGPGWVYKNGYLAGVSVAWDGGVMYVPVRHPDTECRPLAQVVSWVQGLFDNNHVCFFNAGFDAGWLHASGVTGWPRNYDDASVMAVLLDENWDSNSLDSCCERAGIPGKDESLLIEASIAFGVKKKRGGYKHGLWTLPARYVGPYAEQDAIATLALARRLRPEIAAQDMVSAYETERRLIPVINQMRQRGILIDEAAAMRAQKSCIVQRDEQLAKIRPARGRRDVTIDDLRSPAKLAEIFDQEGLSYPRTAKTQQPSFTAQWLEEQNSPLCLAVRRARQLEDVASKFLDNYILGFSHMGRLHAEIHPLRSDTGGTVTSRFAYSNPPLQQMPARDPLLGPLMRDIFQPEPDCLWLAADYSQQEPRLAVHFAALCGIRGAAEAVAYYRTQGAKADFHQMVATMAGIERPRAKIINLGLLYGMGIKKLASSLGLSIEDSTELMELYHTRVPWVKLMTEFCERRASVRGFIRLIDGARRHYDEWEPARRHGDAPAQRRDKAAEVWPNQPLRRAYTRAAMNALVQGSAARQTKIAMVNCAEAGLLPMLTMHDEVGLNVQSARECRLVSDIMIHAVELRVPVRVDAEVGKTWGKAKTSFEEYFA